MLPANSVLTELRRLCDEKQTGVLALGSNGTRVEVFYSEGWIDAVSSNLSTHQFGSYLVKDGYLLSRDLSTVKTEAERRKVCFGESAVRRGLVEEAQVAAAARHQALELLKHSLELGLPIVSFRNALHPLYVPAHITFPHLLLDLSRSNPALFLPDPNVHLRLTKTRNLSALPWYPQELAVLAELRNPIRYPALLAITGLEDSSLQRILGVFDRLNLIEQLENPEVSAENGNEAIVANEFHFEHLVPVVTNAVVHEKLEVARNGGSFTSEQFRSLKVQISEVSAQVPMKVITVSSPDTKDGKSLVSANLASAFAMDPGRRVIIVDCDLRSPALNRYLGVSAEPGLLTYLAEGQLSPYCYTRRLGNLYFLTSGGIAPNPIEILSMPKMRQLIEYLKIDFDTIILDAPPFSPIADARIVTGMSDGLVMVLRRGKTSYSNADRAFKAVDRNKVLGVVFNDVKPLLFHTYHNYGYYRYGDNRYLYSGSSKKGPKSYLDK